MRIRNRSYSCGSRLESKVELALGFFFFGKSFDRILCERDGKYKRTIEKAEENLIGSGFLALCCYVFINILGLEITRTSSKFQSEFEVGDVKQTRKPLRALFREKTLDRGGEEPSSSSQCALIGASKVLSR